MQNFKELTVWKRAHRLVLWVYRISKDLPQSENFGLILNLRRSATHMAARIAEGAGRPTDGEFAVELIVRVPRITNWSISFSSRKIWDSLKKPCMTRCSRR